jgi:co-chaperonin GroES (HSP10)
VFSSNKTPLGLSTDRIPLSKEQIRKGHDNADTYISPNYGDGGWHTTPGCLQFTTEWEPRNDHILVRIEEVNDLKSSIIHIPDSARTHKGNTRTGVVLKCGPGKWIPGEWWNVFKGFIAIHNPKTADGIERPCDRVYEWEWLPGHRREMTVHPGQRVIIGNFSDYETGDAAWGENIVVCQEADVRGIL